jgi:hypothetical protein
MLPLTAKTNVEQPDGRYFKGLGGQYWFNLNFMLREVNSQMGDYICRTRKFDVFERSVSIEIELDAGRYEVLPMIEAKKYDGLPLVETVVQNNSLSNPWKLRQIGLNYDVAHAKGAFDISETPEQTPEKTPEQMPEQTPEPKLEVNSDPKDKSNEVIENGSKQDTKEEVKVETNGDYEHVTTVGPTDSSIVENTAQANVVEEAPITATALTNLLNTFKLDLQDSVAQMLKAQSSANSAVNQAEIPDPAWNAVVVVGLRVYSKDQVNIKLVKPESLVEGALVDVVEAGATA